MAMTFVQVFADKICRMWRNAQFGLLRMDYEVNPAGNERFLNRGTMRQNGMQDQSVACRYAAVQRQDRVQTQGYLLKCVLTVREAGLQLQTSGSVAGWRR